MHCHFLCDNENRLSLQQRHRKLAPDFDLHLPSPTALDRELLQPKEWQAWLTPPLVATRKGAKKGARKGCKEREVA
jgi:hypothetical protein